MMFTQLAARVSLLEAQIERQQEKPGQSVFLATPAAKIAKSRRGPRSRIQHSELSRFRNSLVETLENYWPEIERCCLPSLKAKSLRDVLREVEWREGSQRKLCTTHLLEHFAILCGFVAGDRFRGDPRQIANALAGVPDLSYWRSLKLCQSEPCANDIGLPALRAYVRRKYPRLHDELSERIDEIHFITTLRKYRSEDKAIRNLFPSTLLHAWRLANGQ